MATMKTGLMKEDDDVELELGLSLGGSKKLEKSSSPTVKNENLGPEKIISFGLADNLTKREMHALRRQEAKKKREEKRNRVAAINGEVRESKRNKIEEEVKTNSLKNVNLNLTVEENNVVKKNVNVMPLPNYPYVYQNPNLFMNGFAAVPCWVPVTAGEGTANLVGQSFGGLPNVVNGPAVLLNSKTMSYASPIRSSSLGSDNRSTSHEAGGSSDTKSHCTLPEHTQLNGSNEHSASSYLTEISRVSDESRNCTKNIIQSDAAQSNPSKPKEESADENKADAIKPSRPQENPSLPYMPSVSTTGNGPNGKTVNGFLYRYTKTDISIVCVCHGTSFSPAEFVQHAGGTNITNPLKHITVSPSAF